MLWGFIIMMLMPPCRTGFFRGSLSPEAQPHRAACVCVAGEAWGAGASGAHAAWAMALLPIQGGRGVCARGAGGGGRGGRGGAHTGGGAPRDDGGEKNNLYTSPIVCAECGCGGCAADSVTRVQHAHISRVRFTGALI